MFKSEMPKYYTLIGTSSTGKTTALNHLNSLGYKCNIEPVRKVLTDQVAIDGPALPAKDPKLFIQLMLQLSIKNYNDSKTANGPVFFDRGLPDLVAYARRFKVNPDDFVQASHNYRYNNSVFVFPPWKEIFTAGEFRGGSFEMYQDFHKLIINAYKELNYNLIEVPFDTVEARVNFILNHT